MNFGGSVLKFDDLNNFVDKCNFGFVVFDAMVAIF